MTKVSTTRASLSSYLLDTTLAEARRFRAQAGLPEVADEALIDDDFRTSLSQSHDEEK
jgi:hypothetical protein